MKTRQLLQCAAGVFLAAALQAQGLAPTPPMGWNSWDSYGLRINEQQFRDNVDALAARLKPAGYNYAVIDEGWYMANPEDRPKPELLKYSVDANGRFIPVTTRFPSAEQNGKYVGFEQIGKWVHSKGLKFGVHIVRGIPRESVQRNLPIEGTQFTAQDAADQADACPWDPTSWGIKDNAAGQAWYDSLLRQYGKWGVDFLKVDCISDHPYKGEEILMIAKAIRKSGKPIVLSLSPGPTNLSHAAEVAGNSQMWRIADDIWDGWTFTGTFPNGLLSAFDNLAKWAKYAKPGNWPDADMLPWGSLRPNPGWGRARQSRLTPDEQRTQFTLWAMARSPLILGCNLTELDDVTKSLLTNKEVIAVNQQAVASEEVASAPEDAARMRVWISTAAGAHSAHYMAVFNLENSAMSRDVAWPAALAGASHAAYDVWNQKSVDAAKSLHVDLPAHGCALFRIGAVMR